MFIFKLIGKNQLIKKLLGIKELKKNSLHRVMNCDRCNYGVIVCGGCGDVSEKGMVCAGCKGSGIRTCGKCGGI